MLQKAKKFIVYPRPCCQEAYLFLLLSIQYFLPRSPGNLVDVETVVPYPFAASLVGLVVTSSASDRQAMKLGPDFLHYILQLLPHMLTDAVGRHEKRTIVVPLLGI